ncbi:MAG: glycosyltransferase family 2 protein [Anaerolineae bacterium]|nr:glycosyltransferase family 2 protein [Anaerolineae bacterium]
MKPNLVSIVLPVYNEEQAIGDDLDLIIKTMEASDYDYEIIVVDDGSTDSSADIVRQRSQVRLIRHPYNRGTGAARTTGIKQAEGDVIVMTDGDGTYPNHEIPALVSFLGEYDTVIGARRHERGTLRWLRSPAKLFIRLLASYLTRVRIPDLNSGFRAFRKEMSERYLGILPTTHSWVATITIASLSDGYTVKFMPIDYYPRKGRSTFHPIADTYNYLSLVVRAVMYFDPLRIFLPVALTLLTLGMGKMVYDIFAYDFHFAPSTVTILLAAIQLGAVGLLADLIVRRQK